MTTSRMEPVPNEVVRWPAERFYWAVCEAPGWSRSGLLPEGLRPELEDLAPEPIDRLHAVCTPLPNGRVLVCAARREDLDGLTDGTLRLVPESLPAFVLGSALDADASIEQACASLDLLVGPYEPRPLRRARLLRHALAAACITMCSLVAAFGLSRREAHWSALADAAAAARERLVSETVPETAHQPEALAVELARLRQGREGAQRVRPAADAALALAAVLRGWPVDEPARPQSVAATGTGVSLSVSLDGDPAPFLRALQPPKGWKAGEPRINTSGGTTRITLELRADPGASDAGDVREGAS